MSTYSYNLADNIGKVRLKIGDNIIASPVFTDEELQVFLDENSNNILLASASAAEAWAASYAANADHERIGDYSYSQSIIQKMLSLAARLRENESSSPAMTFASFKFTDVKDTENE